LKAISFEGAEPPEELVEVVAAILGASGVVILPTDTIYGLHAAAADHEAIRRIIAAKLRDDGKPLVVLATDLAQAEEAGAVLIPEVRDVLSSIWPAPLTAILPLRGALAASRGMETIAVRVPQSEWLRRLLYACGPLASSSVNRSGSPPARRPQEIDAAVADGADLVLTGPDLAGSPSTIVDFTSGVPRLVRQGEFLFAQNLWKTLRNSL
jgi:tRNA threonylcarbamoyl adenosine modification protein (Sua5/YciO/YrdC/YwlC family)